MNLLLFNLKTDIDDPILGFTTKWIDALAKHFGKIYIITMHKGKVIVADNVNVYSVGKEKGYSELKRTLWFYRHLLLTLKKEQIDVCFSHMIPIFSILAAPLLKVRQIPIVTWYAHPSITWTLKLAHHLSDKVITSIKSAYPYRQDKLVVVGQGIDTDMFSPDITSYCNSHMILCVGRISRFKDHPTLLKAVRILKYHFKKSCSVAILGGPGNSSDEPYIKHLNDMAEQLDIGDIVHFIPPVSINYLPRWYNKCTVHVNMTPIGSGDKVALEAMACGKPCVVANEGFKDTLGQYANDLLFKYGNPYSLAQRLCWVLSKNEEERKIIGSHLREQVIKLHNLEELGAKLKDILAKCIIETK